MRLFITLFLATSLSFLVSSIPQNAGGSGSCSQRVVRKEWRELSQAEKDTFFDGVNKLKTTKGSSGINKYEEFTKKHLDNVAFAHNTPLFLVWHRKFLREFELAMQDVLGNKGFAMPYWQWSLDSQAPGKPILKKYLPT